MQILKVSQYQTDQVFHQRPQTNTMNRGQTSHMSKFGAFKRALIAKSEMAHKNHRTGSRFTMKAHHLQTNQHSPKKGDLAVQASRPATTMNAPKSGNARCSFDLYLKPPGVSKHTDLTCDMSTIPKDKFELKQNPLND